MGNNSTHSTRKRPREDYEAVISLYATGITMMDVSRKLNIPWTTVRTYIKGRNNKPYVYDKPFKTTTKLLTEDNVQSWILENVGIKEYSYLLGCYFGDGWIDKIKGKITERINIATAINTPSVIKLQSLALSKISNSIVIKKMKAACVNIYTHRNSLSVLFPHYGLGAKHLRKIELTDWQREIIDLKYLWLGLHHSDGSCFIGNYNILGEPVYRFEFVNKSEDIIKLFEECSDFLNLVYTTSDRKTMKNNKICYSKRVVFHKKSSDKLLELFGTKQEFSEELKLEFPITNYDINKIRFNKYEYPEGMTY